MERFLFSENDPEELLKSQKFELDSIDSDSVTPLLRLIAEGIVGPLGLL